MVMLLAVWTINAGESVARIFCGQETWYSNCVEIYVVSRQQVVNKFARRAIIFDGCGRSATGTK
jgi:hypothetical protein